MIRITPTLAVGDASYTITFKRAAGPGGQNVNKVSTAAELRFSPEEAGLPHAMQDRLRLLAGTKLNQRGVLVLTAQDHRTQEGNRRAVLTKLASLLRRAAQKPKKRIATKPSKASKLRRLEQKSQRGKLKAGRRTAAGFED